jgi:hypothetical protein
MGSSLTGPSQGGGVGADDRFYQRTLGFVDPIRWRYEVIRPVVFLRDTTPQQRAHETHTHPYPVRRLVRQFQAQGWRERTSPASNWSHRGSGT